MMSSPHENLNLAPKDPSKSPLAATVAHCLECDQNSEPDAFECEHCDDSVLEFFHVTTAPLGYDDDDDFEITGGGSRPTVWQYIAAEPDGF